MVVISGVATNWQVLLYLLIILSFVFAALWLFATRQVIATVLFKQPGMQSWYLTLIKTNGDRMTCVAKRAVYDTVQVDDLLVFYVNGNRIRSWEMV